jgi:hypothetical protein
LRVAASTQAEVPADLPSHDYKAVTAVYQDKTYPGVILRLADSGAEMELRQWTGKKKKATLVAVARFRPEPNAQVLVDGRLLRVAELSITLESPSAAAEVAHTLGRPAREREALRLLSEAESSVSGFLETRGQALEFISWLKVEPREAMFSARSMWTDVDTDPLDTVYSSYSARLDESLGRMASSIAAAEKDVGPGATERLYALACTIGAVQEALMQEGSDLSEELAALKEFGITATADELRMPRAMASLVLMAHPGLAMMAISQAASS